MSYLRKQRFSHAVILLVVFLVVSLFVIGAVPNSEPDPKIEPRTLPNDLVIVPAQITAEEEAMFGIQGPGSWKPAWNQTSDFMLGTVAVSIILPNCTGAIDPCTQGGWSQSDINQVQSEVQNALAWWETKANAAGANVDFQLVSNTPLIVPTSYEPIDRPGGGVSLCGEEGLWIDEVMANLGFNQSNYLTDVRLYDDSLRQQYHTDWAFTIFVADSSNNPGGMFADTDCGGNVDPPFAVAGWAYLAGPFFAMNTINNGYGSIFMDGTAAHEIGHVFGAPDEVPSWSCQLSEEPTCDSQFGYLGGENQNCNPCLNGGCENPCAIDIPLSMMRAPEDNGTGQIQNVLHNYTEQQLGWADADNDNIPDPVDTTPNLVLTSPPSPTSDISPLYTGLAQDIPFPSALPNQTTWRPAYPSETINKIVAVQFRINGGQWLNASATDGTFDSATESFRFNPLLCTNGTYTIQVRSVNSVNHFSTLQSHTITVNSTSTCTSDYAPLAIKSSGTLLEAPAPSTGLPEGYPAPTTPTEPEEPPVAYP